MGQCLSVVVRRGVLLIGLPTYTTSNELLVTLS